MSVVKINTMEFPPQAADQMVERFLARLDDLSQVDGFLAFELLKPTAEGQTSWFVYTRWTDEDAYQAWRSSESFARGHANSGRPSESSGSDGPTLLEFEVAASVSSVI